VYSCRVSIALTQLMRRMVVHPDQPVVTVPVLLWEAPPSESSPDEDWAPTDAGFRSRPTATDPLVFMVEKVAGRANPFAMGVTVGRVETNDVIVDDGSVSRFHAWLQFDAKVHKWFLCDAESKNGTFIGAQRLKPKEKIELFDGARVKFGDAEMIFLTPDALVKEIKLRGGR